MSIADPWSSWEKVSAVTSPSWPWQMMFQMCSVAGSWCRRQLIGWDKVNIFVIAKQSIIKFLTILSSLFFRKETTVAEKFLGHFGDNQEHYVLARIEEHVPHIKNNTLLLIDSIPYSPVEHFQVFKLSQLLVKAGTLFQYKVKTCC